MGTEGRRPLLPSPFSLPLLNQFDPETFGASA